MGGSRSGSLGVRCDVSSQGCMQGDRSGASEDGWAALTSMDGWSLKHGRLRPLWEQAEVRGDPREREENPKGRQPEELLRGRKPAEPASLEAGKEGTQKGGREPRL